VRIHFCHIILVFFIFLPGNLHSQVNCIRPESPVLTLVSVDPETGDVELKWDLSPSDGIAAYVLYTYNDGAGLPLPDTLWDPTATGYSYNNPATAYFSIAYVAAAHRLPNCTSPLSNDLNTIFTEAIIDTCNKRITISWNKYRSEPKKVTGYRIISSLNGGAYSTIAETGENTLSYIMEDFITDSEYCFVVIASLEDGMSSKSNKSCLSTRMQRPPEWINADYATVKDNKISLSFTVDPGSEISSFSLERKTGLNGSFTEIAKPVYSDGIVLYTDDKADPDEINTYRLSAMNNCNNPITISNLASNIVLSMERVNSDINLSWNKYREWRGGVSSYKIYTDTGNGYREFSEISASDSSFIIDYSDIMYDVSSGEVCFQVTAYELPDSDGRAGSSTSQAVCTTPAEVITVPDVFTPNNDLINDLFRPVLSFTPSEYHLIITDRKGVILFETRDSYDSWNGTQSGDPVPQGVYLWYLKVITPSGTGISKTGSIAVYFNR
jgi:gliding motility-associated-like protein